MMSSSDEIELSEDDKEEFRRLLKETFGGMVQQYLGAVVGVCMAIIVVRAGLIPFVPHRLSTANLLAIAVVAALGWIVLQLGSTRPAKKRLKQKLEELEEES